MDVADGADGADGTEQGFLDEVEEAEVEGCAGFLSWMYLVGLMNVE